MSKELEHYQSASLDDRMRYAEVLAAAGDLIPKGFRNSDGSANPGKILLALETGSMLDLAPMAALQGIDVIEGKATISPQLMSGLIRASGHKIVIEQSGTIPAGDLTVTVKGVRSDDETSFTSVWDLHRASRAGLCGYKEDNNVWKLTARSQKGNPLPWEMYPEAMLRARAIGEVGRTLFDDVLKGISYTKEEIQSSGDHIYAETTVEASEDWEALISAAETREELDEISARLKETGEGTDKIRTAWLARAGILQREEDILDVEIIEETERDPAEPTEEEMQFYREKGEVA